MKDDLRYTPSDCFETFPFPLNYEGNKTLNNAGSAYYEFRSRAMVDGNQGLTKIYNRFHDIEENSPEIVQLRYLHNELDRAVLDSYNWLDIHPTCEFIQEYEDEENEDESRQTRKSKYRHRWPDEIRDEVLARLLQLNRQRAVEQGQSVPSEMAAHVKKSKRTNSKKGKKQKAKDDDTTDLFALGQEEA